MIRKVALFTSIIITSITVLTSAAFEFESANQQTFKNASKSNRVILPDGQMMFSAEKSSSSSSQLDGLNLGIKNKDNHNTKDDGQLNVILQLEKSPLIRFLPAKQSARQELVKNAKNSYYSKAVDLQRQAIVKDHQSVISSLKPLGLDKSISRQFSYLYNGLALTIPRQQLPLLTRIPGIKKVHVVEDRKPHLDISVNLIGADQVWQQQDANETNITGKGIKVAVIDTGVDYTRDALGGCFGEGCRVYDGYDFINDDNDPMDDQGHGTHVAGIIGANGSIKGVAPDVSFVAYKVCDYSCPTDGIIAALEKAVDPDGDPLTDDGVDVVNISIGGGFSLDDPLTVAVDELSQNGTLVVISAGNEGEGQFTITSPGNAEHALTVASTTKEDMVSSFSSRGPLLTESYQKPEISAPGSDIYSLAIGEGLVSLSGTSMAAPHVAGAAALVKQKYPQLEGQQIKALLTTNTDDIGYEFFEAGSGRLNAFKAAQAQILSSKSYLLFERLDRSASEVILETSVELSNISAAEITINLSFANEVAGISYEVLEGDELTISANQTQTINLKVTIDTNAVNHPDALLHRADLVITNASFTSAIPILIFDAIKFDWNLDQYSDSVWIHNKDNGKSWTINYQQSGSEYVLPGNYFFSSFTNYGDSFAVVVKELADVKQDTVVSITKADALHKIKVEEFTDHVGNLKSVDNLYGGGTYVEVAYPENLDRQFHFWAWQDSGYFSRYPVYISDLPHGLEFNFSFMAGDKNTSSESYHVYIHTESKTEISSDISFSLNGTTEKKVEFNVPVNTYSDEKFNWRLRNTLEWGQYRWPKGWARYAHLLEGPSSWMNSDQADIISGEFTITLHGNEFSNERFGYYELLVGDFNNGYESSIIKFEHEGSYSLYNHKFGVLPSREKVELPNYRLAGEAIFSNALPYWQNEYISIEGWLFGANNSRIGSNYTKEWLLICDDLIVKSIQAAYWSGNVPDDSQCSNKRIEHFFINYLYGRKQLSSFVTGPRNTTRVYQINQSSAVNENAETVDVIDILLEIKQMGVSKDNLTAWINTSGQWQQLGSSLLQSNTENWPYSASYRMILPTFDEPSLASIKIQFDDGSDFFTLIQPNAYLLGGTQEELIALDNDDDGINDLEDYDRDNDGIPDDIEILNGLNHLDANDANGDIDQDGLTNLEEFNQGRFIRYFEDDRDGDGVADHLDVFPDDPSEAYDTDNDGIGNNADLDDDNDGVEDAQDAFPLDENEWLDSDLDGMGNNADTDDDNDGIEDTLDAFPLDPYEYLDTDNDGIGNNTDSDDDNDGVEDAQDAFPLDPYEYLDTDNDGIGNNADNDDDGDGVADDQDAFPLDQNEYLDTDNDGIGNNEDTDDDNDGVEDAQDVFPLDSSESVDTDNDGIGNNADNDDDGDSVADSADAFPLDASRSASVSTNTSNNASKSSGGSIGYLMILFGFVMVRRKRLSKQK